LRIGCEKGSGCCSLVDVEKYGGMINYTWFDRPLSVAGRVCYRKNGSVAVKTVNIDRDLLVIPSLCIHFQRNINEGFKPDVAKDMRPLFSADKNGETILSIIAKQLDIGEQDIISHDLFTYVRQRGSVFGADNGLYMVPRLDDLGCVFTTLKGFLNAKDNKATNVFVLFDNEEVGNATKQGAASPLLYDVLSSIAGERYLDMLNNSMMVSADNGHATHPNYREASDSEYGTSLGKGFIVKYNASQKYTTDGLSHAVFAEICAKASIKPQVFYNKANVIGGGTLGSISNTNVPVMTVDIGLPQLAMHSAVETAAVSDVESLVSAMTAFFESTVTATTDGYEIG